MSPGLSKILFSLTGASVLTIASLMLPSGRYRRKNALGLTAFPTNATARKRAKKTCLIVF
jgi:hypothetical protein